MTFGDSPFVVHKNESADFCGRLPSRFFALLLSLSLHRCTSFETFKLVERAWSAVSLPYGSRGIYSNQPVLKCIQKIVLSSKVEVDNGPFFSIKLFHGF